MENSRRRTKQRKRTTIFGTWNVQGISRKVNEVASELKHLKVDIAILTETKKKGKGSESWEYTIISTVVYQRKIEPSRECQ